MNTPEGPQDREVVIGLSNEKLAEVKSGLEEGDQVVLNPRVLLGDKAKTREAGPGEKPAGEGQDAKGKGKDGPPAVVTPPTEGGEGTSPSGSTPSENTGLRSCSDMSGPGKSVASASAVNSWPASAPPPWTVTATPT